MAKKSNQNWQKTLPPEWTVKMAGQDGQEMDIPMSEHPALRDYATKDEAVKALVHAQKLLGKTPEGYVRIPAANDAPEQLDGFYRALGRPDAPEEYELPHIDLPDGLEVEEAILEQFRTRAHQLGLIPQQVSGLYEWFLPVVLDTHHGIEAEKKRLQQSELQALRSVHRGETPRMLDAALRTAEALGGEELLRALDATRAGDRAAVVSAFAKMAPLVLESGLRGSPPAGVKS